MSRSLIIIVKGPGYYHLYTREAYQAILNRIEKQQAKEKSERNCVLLYGLIPFFIPVACCVFFQIKSKLQKLEGLKTVTTLRMNAAGPSSEIDIPPEILDEMKKNSKKRNHDDTNNYHDGSGGIGDIGNYYGTWYYFREEVFTRGEAGCV